MAKHAAHAAPEPEPVKRSRSLKRKLIVAIVILILAIVGLAVLLGVFLKDGSDKVQTDVSSQKTDVETIQGNPKTDASTQPSAKTEVPAVATLIGLTQDEALAALAHGAVVTSSKELPDDPDAKGEATVTLTEEPSEARTGAPQVYLTFGNDDRIKRAGYTSSVSALGYSTVAIRDVILQEHIVEESLRAAGLAVQDGTVTVPDDKASYSTYASDGKTLTREVLSFEGSADADGVARAWEAVVYYDYVTANTTGKLSDTVRQLYVYVS